MKTGTPNHRGQKRAKMGCPVCKGKGEIIAPLKRHRTVSNTIMAHLLHKEGYSQRDIMRFLGYRSPRSVSLCLKRKVPSRTEPVG